MPTAFPLSPPVAIIAGPTASGKSALALDLAERTGGTVINADSAQVYRDLRIITARPYPADEAHAPHLLYGTRDGARACSAADWAADARAAVAGIHAAGGLPILVGGTGLYLRTLLDGIAPVPPIDATVREAVRTASVADNHHALAREDPQAAALLNPGDSQRIGRALEVIRSTGRSILSWRADRHGGIAANVRVVGRVLLPARALLNARCDERFVRMMDEGGIGEVEALLARGLDLMLPVMNAIGVREIADLLAERQSREEALAAGQLATRQYVKRQTTWFRNQAPAAWLRIDGEVDVPAFAADCVRG